MFHPRIRRYCQTTEQSYPQRHYLGMDPSLRNRFPDAKTTLLERTNLGYARPNKTIPT